MIGSNCKHNRLVNMASSSTNEVLSPSLASKLANHHPKPSSSPSAADIEFYQAQHRIALLNLWGSGAIFPGARVLELGCGQGTCTAVLAVAVGSEGWVDGVDPGSPDYGAPWTLAQAQAHLSKGSWGAGLGGILVCSRWTFSRRRR